MNVLLISICLFTFAFVLHVAVWRIRLPHRQTRTLLIMFMGVMAAAFAVFWYAGRTSPEYAAVVPMHLSDYLQIALFHVSFTLSYVITYSALEADSPSLVIVRAIEAAGPEGLDKDVLYEKLNDDILVLPRVRDLIRDEMAVIEDGKYRLTEKGRSFIGLFIFYRKLMGAPLRGG
jgi:hypothetical protein